MLREMRIWDLVVGVEMWKVTLSKSETIWSMEVGVALGKGYGQNAGADIGTGVVAGRHT